MSTLATITLFLAMLRSLSPSKMIERQKDVSKSQSALLASARMISWELSMA